MKLRSSNQAAAEKTKSISTKSSQSQKMMKLRSGNHAAAIVNNPIPQILPATKKMTSRNLSSPLLKLPSEVRNRIYYFVNGGNFIHVEGIPTRHSHFRIVLCRATVSEEDAQSTFETTLPSKKSMYDAANRHSCCFEGLGSDSGSEGSGGYSESEGSCSDSEVEGFGTDSEFEGLKSTPGATKIPVGLLRTCRQIYLEAKYTLYSTNTFSFRNPENVSWFCSKLESDLSGHESAIRNIHFDMAIDYRTEETRWDEAIKELGDRLHGVQHVKISIHEATVRKVFGQTRRNRYRIKYWDPTQEENTILAKIPSLRRLSLRTLKLSVFYSDRSAWFDEYESSYEWTHEQKQEWARNTERATLSWK